MMTKITNAETSIAVIGAGGWGQNLVRNFARLGVLRSVCEYNDNNLKRALELHDVEGVRDYRDILSRKDIDGVAIATPAVTHADMAREALAAGKDVYVEKPLCLSEEEGVELNQLARDSGRILMVGHLLWYHPAILKLQELINFGALGRIEYIYSNRLNMGKLRREESVLWSFAPHDISVILGLLEEMPQSVTAQGGNFLHQRIADTTVSLLNFVSGVRAHIFVSWLHPFKEQKLVVVGDRGMAVFDDGLPWSDKLQIYPHSVHWSEHVPVAHKAEAERVALIEEEPLKAECAHFVECMETRNRPRTDGDEGLKVLRVLNACQRSLEASGLAVALQGPIERMDYSAHPSAQIDSDVRIGKDTKIWHFSHILSGTRIGERCNIGQNVVIGPQGRVGDGCKIQNNVSVYQGVTLEDEVFCGPSMVFTNVFNPRSRIPRRDELRETRVKQGATIGANATVICGHTLGRHCFVGAGAVVTRDVPDYALVVGNPARRVGWMCECGERLRGDLSCVCGRRYAESKSGIAEITE